MPSGIERQSHLLLHRFHGREEHLGALDADDAGAHVVVAEFVGVHAGVLLDVLEGAEGESHGADAVHW
jgi:hypothetical protein